MALKDQLTDLVDSIALKTNDLHNAMEKSENKKQGLDSTDPAAYPSVPAVREGLAFTLDTAQDYTDIAIGDVSERFDDFIPLSQKGAANGVAETGGDNKILAQHLPSFVDDVIEADSFAELPETGETGKIYVTIDEGLTYRWSGSQYAEISPSLALGETASTAYRGDRGKIAYDHTLRTDNPHNVTKAQVGLSNVNNTSDANKPVSTAQAAAINAVQTDLNSFRDDIGTDFPDYNLMYLNSINYNNI